MPTTDKRLRLLEKQGPKSHQHAMQTGCEWEILK